MIGGEEVIPNSPEEPIRGEAGHGDQEEVQPVLGAPGHDSDKEVVEVEGDVEWEDVKGEEEDPEGKGAAPDTDMVEDRPSLFDR